jgi:hypothetical protein
VKPSGMGMRYEAFVSHLEETFPELVVRERDLPHLAMGQLVLLLKDATGDEVRFAALSNRVLDFIDVAASSDDERVVNLVAVSFLENLHMLGPACSRFVEILGSRARRACRQVSGPLCDP